MNKLVILLVLIIHNQLFCMETVKDLIIKNDFYELRNFLDNHELMFTTQSEKNNLRTDLQSLVHLNIENKKKNLSGSRVRIKEAFGGLCLIGASTTGESWLLSDKSQEYKAAHGYTMINTTLFFAGVGLLWYAITNSSRKEQYTRSLAIAHLLKSYNLIVNEKV